MTRAEVVALGREQMAAHYRDGRHRIAETLGASIGGRDPAVMAALLLALFDGLLLQHGR